MKKHKWHLRESFAVVPPINIETKSLYIQTESCAVFKLPLCLDFVGLGFYPYTPMVSPKKDPGFYGLAPTGGGIIYEYKNDLYSLYLPPHDDFFYLTLVNNVNIKIRIYKDRYTNQQRDYILAQLIANESLPGSLLTGFKVGDDLFEDPITKMMFNIKSSLMCLCQ